MKNIKFLDGDFVNKSETCELIYESGGFSKKEQYMNFESDGIDITVEYTLDANGTSYEEPGDYYTPPVSEVIIDKFDITIVSITIDGYEVELEKEMISNFKKVVESNL